MVTPLPESVITDVFVHIGFQVVGLGAEDGLHAGASDDYAGCAQFLQARLVNFGHVGHADAQTGDTSIQVSDVFFTAEGLNQRRGHFGTALRSLLGSGVFTARGFQIQLGDQHAEDGVVHQTVDDADDWE